MGSRRKEILLLVLALAALGIALYTFRGKPAPPPAGGTVVASQPGPAPAQEKAGASAAGQEGGEQAEATEEGSPENAGGGQQRNPFSTPGAPVAGSAEGAPEAGAEGAAPEPAAGPDQGDSGGQMSLTLTGIIDGRQTVAILRQNDQRYFVKVGDLIGDGYRVQSIGNQQVVLAGQQGKVILRMGGRQ